MARIEESITIKCPVDKVFAYTMDVKGWPKWHSNFTDAEQISQGQMCIGTIIRETTRGMGVTKKWTGKVTEYEPNRKCTMNMTGRGIIIQEHLICDPIEGGTKATVVFDMQFRRLFKLFAPLMISSMPKELKKNLSNLKSILEAQT